MLSSATVIGGKRMLSRATALFLHQANRFMKTAVFGNVDSLL